MSRDEQILTNIINDNYSFDAPQSRIEELLINLGDKIENINTDPETITQAVNDYLDEHPVQAYDDTEIRQEIADLKDYVDEQIGGALNGTY